MTLAPIPVRAPDPTANSAAALGHPPGHPNLRPWQKGQSGNPAGKTRLAALIDRYAGRQAVKAIEGYCLIALGTAAEREAFFGEPVRVSGPMRAEALWRLISARHPQAKIEAATTNETAIQVNLLVPIP
jgi:hypothetical protein